MVCLCTPVLNCHLLSGALYCVVGTMQSLKSCSNVLLKLTPFFIRKIVTKLKSTIKQPHFHAILKEFFFLNSNQATPRCYLILAATTGMTQQPLFCRPHTCTCVSFYHCVMSPDIVSCVALEYENESHVWSSNSSRCADLRFLSSIVLSDVDRSFLLWTFSSLILFSLPNISFDLLL